MRLPVSNKLYLNRIVASLLALVGIGLLHSLWAAPQANVFVVDRILVASSRHSRDLSDFTYRIKITNQGRALAHVSAFVRSASPNTVILDNEVLIGDVPAGSTFIPNDTFSLRQNRLVLFKPGDLIWTIEGEVANTRPVANAGPDQTVRTGTTVTLDGTGSSDADGNSLTYRWSLTSRPAGSSATLSSTTAGRPTFIVDRGGTYVFSLIVNDGLVDSLAAAVRVSTTNSTPIANAGPDRTVARGSTVTLDGSGSSDPDFDALGFNWTLVGAPIGSTAVLNNATTMNPSLTLDKPGSYTVRLTVTDGQLTSAPATVVISTENSAPVANAGADQSANVGARITLDGSGSSDADNDPLSFSWTWVSRPANSTSFLDTSNSLHPFFTADVAGLYVVQLIVNDGFANSAPDTVTVTISVPANHPPSAVNDSATTDAGVPVTIDVLANDSDPDPNTTLTITSFTQPPTGGAVVQVAGGLRFTPSAGFSGVSTFQYTISDGSLSATAFVNVTVNATANQRPVVNAGADQSVSLPSNGAATITLNGVVSDDGKPTPATLTIAWSTVSGPGAVTFSAPNAAISNASFTVAGTYVLRLSASDGQLTGSDDVQVVVNPPANTAPTLNPISDRSINVGTTLQLQLLANDPDSPETLTYSMPVAPAGATFASPQISWTPSNAQIGTYTFTVSVHDLAGASDSKTFHVTVVSANRAPVFGPLVDDTTTTFAHYAKSISVSDPDGDPVVVSLLDGPAGLTLSGGTLAWTPGGNQVGSYTVKLRATDSHGAFSAGLFKVTVSAILRPIAHDDSYSARVGETITIPAAGVLTNDISPNATPLTAIKRSDPVLGSLSAFNANGSLIYTAPAVNPKPPFAATGRILSADPQVWDGSLDWPVMGDLDRDGKPDLITTHFNGGSILATSGGDGHRLWAVNPTCRYLSNGSAPTEILADIDDDGRLEYVFTSDCPGDTAGWTRLQALADNGQTKWTSEPLTKPFFDIVCASAGNCGAVPQRVEFEMASGVSLAVARLGANEAPTLMLRQYISAQAASVYTRLDDGSYGYKYYGCRIATGIAADMGQACMVTLLISTTDGSVQQVLRSPVRHYNNPSGYLRPYIRSAPQAVDLDGDGQVEIVSGADVWKRVNGVWTLAFQSQVEPQQVAVVDLDGDGKPEIVHQIDHATNGGYADDPLAGFAGFIIYDHNGVEQRRFPVPVYFAGMLTVTDVDGDGVPEFLMVNDGYLNLINSDGSFKWTYAVPDHPIWSVPSGQRTTTLTNVQVYDLDGDGNKEVIFSSAGWLHILDGRTGAEKVRFDVGRRQNGNYGAAFTFVTDWDNDGHADILTTSLGTGAISDPGNWVITAANNDWLPAGKYYGVTDYRPSGIDDAGHVLFDPSVPRSVRNPKQLGVVRDPRVTAGTSFEYAANDGAADSDNAKVFLEIRPPNSPPVFTSRPPTAIQADGPSPYVYQATAIDPDPGDTVTYSLSAFASNGLGTDFFTINPSTGAVSIPRNPIYGRFTVRLSVTATDSQGAAAVQAFVLVHETAAPVAVPDVVGNALSVATQVLNSASLHSNVLQQQFNALAAGTIIAQNPSAGVLQPLGSLVLLTVSKGPAPAIVPNIVGRFETSAITALTAAGFTSSVTRQFSNTVDAGVVISQAVAAGTEQAGGAIGVVISAGSGLDLRLARSVTPSNETIPFTLVATDLAGNAIGAPLVLLSIAAVSATSGQLPTAGAASITPAANTRGRYRLTASDSGKTVSAEFVVAQPNTVAKPTQLERFAELETVLVTMDKLLADANTARLANDTVTMNTKMIAWVNTWRSVNLNRLALAVPVVPESGFPPEVEDLAGFGVTQSSDDALNETILGDASVDLRDLEEALLEPTTPYQQVVRMFHDFNVRAERIRSVAPGEYGVVDAKGLYAELLAHRIPRVLDALVEDVAHVFGLPARAPLFPQMADNRRQAVEGLPALNRWSSPLLASRGSPHDAIGQRSGTAADVYVNSTLAEQLGVIAVQQIVDAIGAGYTVRKFYQAAFTSAVGGAAVLAAAHHIRAAIGGVDPDLIVTTGASFTINIFRAPYSSIEGLGLNGKHPELNKVMIVGPALFPDLSDLLNRVRALGGLSSTAVHVAPASNLDESNAGVDAFEAGVEDLLHRGSGLFPELNSVYQDPDWRSAVSDCLFSSGPLCRSIQYRFGFYSVYKPTGVVLPAPVLMLAVNTETGATLVGSPVFIPSNN